MLRLNRWRNGGFSVLATLALVAITVQAGWVQQAENWIYDRASAASSPPPLAEIAIIGIDDKSLASIGQWPWTRDVHARLIDEVAAAGAKTIVYTVPFADTQSEAGLTYMRQLRTAIAALPGEPSAATNDLMRLAAQAETALNTDTRLAESIHRAGNVLLASAYMPTGIAKPLPSYVRRSALTEFGNEATSATGSATHPIAALGQVAAGIGHLQLPVDDDGVLRQIPLLLQYDSTAVASLAVLTALHSLHLAATDLHATVSPPSLLLGTLAIATNKAAVMRPQFYAPQRGQSRLAITPFADVLAGKSAPGQWQDKIVLVGLTSPSLTTQLPVPGPQTLAPVEVLGHAVSGIRQARSIVVANWATTAAWTAALLALAYVGWGAPRLPLLASLFLSAALALSLITGEWIALRTTGQWVPSVLVATVLLWGQSILTMRRIGGYTPRTTQTDTAETDRMMGLALHGQGQLDMAYERLRRVPPSDALMDNLYHLAQDFERKRNFAKAQVVYERILRHDRHYKDARARHKKIRARLKAKTDSQANPSSSTFPSSLDSKPSTSPTALAASSLGRYVLDKEIGKGAMGLVYLGRDPKIGRIVAIKTLALQREFEGEALLDARARFFREAETAGRLQHPHIVTIYDAGEDQGLAYIAMEFLSGADLSPACQPDHLLPVPMTLSIAARVADALDYAHAHNVVHRDIKPANIMFDAATNTVKVTDFGIARITDSSKTRTGLVLGTPSFMSPEQLAGKKVDGRSDLYSLGVTLFQLLTGVLPLRGVSMTELMHKIAKEEAPDIRSLRPDINEGIARFVAKALQKQPEARYQTGRLFAEELQRMATVTDAPAGTKETHPVHYDAVRDANGQEMADFQETVLEQVPAMGIAKNPSEPGIRRSLPHS